VSAAGAQSVGERLVVLKVDFAAKAYWLENLDGSHVSSRGHQQGSSLKNPSEVFLAKRNLARLVIVKSNPLAYSYASKAEAPVNTADFTAVSGFTEAIAALIKILGGPAAALTAGVVATGTFAFVVAAALWWSYFDLSGGVAKRQLLQQGHDQTRPGVHDFYVYAHLPVAVSLAAVAVGLEHAIVHGADDHLSTGTRAVLGIGLAGYLASAALIQAVLARHVRAALLWPGTGVLLVLIVCMLDLRPALLLALLAVIMVSGVATGIAQHRAGEIRTAQT